MRIIVTDEGMIWNHEMPILEKYKNVVLVVCLNGKKVTDRYECIVSPYKANHLGMDQAGISSAKFQALKEVKDDILRKLGNFENVLILSDMNPVSLYPYLLLKDENRRNKLHLWCMSPLKIESKKRQDAFWEMAQHFTKLKSLLYIDSNALLKEDGSARKLFKTCSEKFAAMLPGVIYQIQERLEDDRYFYDVKSERYIRVANPRDDILKAKPVNEIDVKEYRPAREFRTLGLLIPREYLPVDEKDKDFVRELQPRPDGKKVCRGLKRMRKALAKANHIPFETVNCPATGACAGTCEQCDQEILYLQEQLSKIETPVYPQFEIRNGLVTPVGGNEDE